MFIDFTGARPALRQEGHVFDPTQCMSPEAYMTLLTEGRILNNPTL